MFCTKYKFRLSQITSLLTGVFVGNEVIVALLVCHRLQYSTSPPCWMADNCRLLQVYKTTIFVFS